MESLPDDLLRAIYDQSILMHAPIDFIILLEHEMTHRSIFQ